MRGIVFLALGSLSMTGCMQPIDDGYQTDGELAEAPYQATPIAAETMCDIEPFDLDQFDDYIMPILNGEVDLSPPHDDFPGCTRPECHGRDRGEGTLFLDASDTAENNLGRFACFVDLDHPRESQILLCPLSDDDCVTHPHPGADIFTGKRDRNYRRVLRYIRHSSVL